MNVPVAMLTALIVPMVLPGSQLAMPEMPQLERPLQSISLTAS